MAAAHPRLFGSGMIGRIAVMMVVVNESCQSTRLHFSFSCCPYEVLGSWGAIPTARSPYRRRMRHISRHIRLNIVRVPVEADGANDKDGGFDCACAGNRELGLFPDGDCRKLLVSS